MIKIVILFHDWPLDVQNSFNDTNKILISGEIIFSFIWMATL